MELVDYKSLKNRYFVRTEASEADVEAAFGSVEYIAAEGVLGERGFLTEQMSEAEYEERAKRLGSVLQMIRVA